MVYSTPIDMSAALYIKRAISPLAQWSTPRIPVALPCLSLAGFFFLFVWITAQVLLNGGWSENVFTLKAILYSQCTEMKVYPRCWRLQWHLSLLPGWTGDYMWMSCWRCSCPLQLKTSGGGQRCSQTVILEVMAAAQLCAAACPYSGFMTF